MPTSQAIILPIFTRKGDTDKQFILKIHSNSELGLIGEYDNSKSYRPLKMHQDDSNVHDETGEAISEELEERSNSSMAGLQEFRPELEEEISGELGKYKIHVHQDNRDGNKEPYGNQNPQQLEEDHEELIQFIQQPEEEKEQLRQQQELDTQQLRQQIEYKEIQLKLKQSELKLKQEQLKRLHEKQQQELKIQMDQIILQKRQLERIKQQQQLQEEDFEYHLKDIQIFNEHQEENLKKIKRDQTKEQLILRQIQEQERKKLEKHQNFEKERLREEQEQQLEQLNIQQQEQDGQLRQQLDDIEQDQNENEQLSQGELGKLIEYQSEQQAELIMQELLKQVDEDIREREWGHQKQNYPELQKLEIQSEDKNKEEQANIMKQHERVKQDSQREERQLEQKENSVLEQKDQANTEDLLRADTSRRVDEKDQLEVQQDEDVLQPEQELQETRPRGNVPGTMEHRPSPLHQRGRFAVFLNVCGYQADDLTVTVSEDKGLVVTGRTEVTSRGTRVISRHFQRRYRIPHEIDPQSLKCNLTADGILLITSSNYSSGRNSSATTSSASTSSSYNHSAYNFSTKNSSGNNSLANKSSINNSAKIKGPQKPTKET